MLLLPADSGVLVAECEAGGADGVVAAVGVVLVFGDEPA